jgi:predicted small metal-binding protein
MRVLECNFCGETLSTGSEDELRNAVIKHVESTHPDEEFDEETADEWVSQAYEATDS